MARGRVRVAGLGDLSTREYRSALAKLKSVGLVSQRIDARSHRPTRHMREQLSRFADVVKGTAKAVKVGRTASREFSGTHRAKLDRVVIEAKPADRARYSKVRNEITVNVAPTRRAGAGRKIVIVPRAASVLPAPRSGYVYGVGMRRGTEIDYIELGDSDDVSFFLSGYGRKGGELGMHVVLLESD